MNNGQHTINQHYIPCCVLKFFKESDDVYNKNQKRIFHVIHRSGKVFPSTVDRIMSGEYFYEHPNFALNRVEDELKLYEDWYSPRHGKFVALVDKYNDGHAKFSEVKNEAFKLVEPMILMHLRSGAMMYELNFWQREHRTMNGIYQMLERVRNRNYTTAFAQTLINFYDFCIIQSNNKDFIISDQFLSSAALSFKAQFMNATNRSIGQKDLIVLLPLSKSYYLCFYDGNKPDYIRANQLRKLNEIQTNEINKMIINNSYMQSAAPSFDLLYTAVKHYKDASPRGFYYGGGGAELRKEVFFYDDDEKIWDFVRFFHSHVEFRDVKKNELCPCGTGKVFGDCCRYKVRAFDNFMDRVEIQSKNKYLNPYTIDGCFFRELNITEYHQRGKVTDE